MFPVPMICYVIVLFCFVKARIVRLLFSCKLSQADNCCRTTIIQIFAMPVFLISVSGVLHGHYTIDSFYNWNLWLLLWCLSFFLPLYCLMPFYCVFWSYTRVQYFMNVFVCVRKWHNKTVQSINHCSHWSHSHIKEQSVCLGSVNTSLRYGSTR